MTELDTIRLLLLSGGITCAILGVGIGIYLGVGGFRKVHDDMDELAFGCTCAGVLVVAGVVYVCISFQLGQI